MKTELYVACDGTIQVIGEIPKELELTGNAPRVRHRASRIVPLHRGKRFMFLFLRAIFGERGITAEWTRGWHGPWIGWLFATGETYIHQSRRVVLKWERERLAELMES